MTKDNHRLGTFELTGIPPAPRGVPQVEVTFNIDANGILSVSAEDKSTGKKNHITIKNEKGRLSDAEIQRMLDDAKKFEAEDKQMREKVAARCKLEGYAFQVKQALDEHGAKLEQTDRDRARAACDDTIGWIERNQTAEIDEIQAKEKELEAVCRSVMSKLHGAGSQPCGQQASGPSAGGFGQGNYPGGPTVEEVD